ncbi:MAG: PIN domain-containing protein, partial [bacterium]
MVKILDAHPLLVFLEREEGYDKVKSYFINAAQIDNNLLMTSVNYGEVYYIVLRRYGQEIANGIEKIIKGLPIEIVNVDLQLAIEAAKLKATIKIP